jgi:hypothetical protein
MLYCTGGVENVWELPVQPLSASVADLGCALNELNLTNLAPLQPEKDAVPGAAEDRCLSTASTTE